MRGTFTFHGKRYYVSGKDEKEVAVKKELKRMELEQGKIIESNMLVRDWSKEWLETYKIGSCGDETIQSYHSRLNIYVLPQIGSYRLKDIKPVHLQKIMKQVSGMSDSLIVKLHVCLKQMFDAAEENELILKSPARNLKRPKGTSGSHRALTDQEREVLLKVAETHKHGLWVKIMLYCGLRTGEVLRLKPCHFDFEKKTLFVDGTKTKNAKRTVPVPDEILEAVKASGKEPFELMFTNEVGNKMSAQNAHAGWKMFKKAMHVEMGGKLYRGEIVPPCLVADDLVPYCLRHTFCTDLQDAGVPINVAKELMGHSNIAMTAKIYTHYTERAFENARDMIDSYRKIVHE